jgi:hypothetical protein
MKPPFLIFIAAFFSSIGIVQAEDAVKSYAGFELSTRTAITLDETFYNPFKLTAHQASLPSSTKTGLTNEQIAQLLGERKVQGLIFGPDGATGIKAIIGDAVFSVGDELAFYDSNNVLTDLSPDGSVRLLKITREYLEFEISVLGQSSRTMEYSLSSLNLP